MLRKQGLPVACIMHISSTDPNYGPSISDLIHVLYSNNFRAEFPCCDSSSNDLRRHWTGWTLPMTSEKDNSLIPFDILPKF